MRDSICNDCAKRTRCNMAEIGRSPLAISTCYCYEKGNPSNADRIRGMTDEELAEACVESVACFVCPMTFDCDGRKIGKDACKAKWLDWLKQEAQCTSE